MILSEKRHPLFGIMLYSAGLICAGKIRRSMKLLSVSPSPAVATSAASSGSCAR
jgi:hypothetical protein